MGGWCGMVEEAGLSASSIAHVRRMPTYADVC
jgi:hypothetical protein